MVRFPFWLILCFVSVLSFAIPQSAYACSCEPPPPPKVALEQADVVFTGTVVEIEEQQPERWGPMFFVKFKVSRSWKGVDGEEATVVTTTEEASCGYAFALGEDYLVYAGTQNFITDELGFPATGICDRTKLLGEAHDEVMELDRATAVMPSLWGRIKYWFSSRAAASISRE